MEICVTTRRAWKTQLRALEDQSRTGTPPSSPSSSPLTDTSDLSPPEPSRATSSKRHRAPSLAEMPARVTRSRKIKKRVCDSVYTSGPSSGDESRQRSLTLEEPIYRSDRSRSASVFPPQHKVFHREWWSTEDGSPGDGFVSATDVVRRLAKTYKSCKGLADHGLSTIAHY